MTHCFIEAPIDAPAEELRAEFDALASAGYRLVLTYPRRGVARDDHGRSGPVDYNVFVFVKET